MRIRISLGFIISFLLLQVVLLELHELAHISTGYLICGCWGHRDFNVWALCTDCDKTHSLSWIATAAGPLFSFAVMWIGMAWLSSTNYKKSSLGFSLIFTSIPLGRISEIIKGGGDEMVVTKYLLKNGFSHDQMIIICSVAVLLLILPPVIKAARFIRNRNSWLYLTGFLTLPIVFILIYILIVMNSLLNTGFLSFTWIMGTPLLISLHTISAAIFLILMRKSLYSLNSLHDH